MVRFTIETWPYNADGDTLRRGLAERVNLLRVQKPEQLRLGLQRQVADLVRVLDLAEIEHIRIGPRVLWRLDRQVFK